MIRSIRDLVLSLFMLGWECLLIFVVLTKFDRPAGLLHQSMEYYILVTVFCILAVVFDIHIKESQKRVDAL